MRLKCLFLTPWGYWPLSPFLKYTVSFFLPDYFLLLKLDLGRIPSADYNGTVQHVFPQLRGFLFCSSRDGALNLSLKQNFSPGGGAPAPVLMQMPQHPRARSLVSPGPALGSWQRGRRRERRGRGLGAEVTRALHPAQGCWATGGAQRARRSELGERAEGRAAGPSGARAGAGARRWAAREEPALAAERSREHDGTRNGAPFSPDSPAGGRGCQGNQPSSGCFPTGRSRDAPPHRGGISPAVLEGTLVWAWQVWTRCPSGGASSADPKGFWAARVGSV